MTLKQRTVSPSSAFTVMELLVVISIIAILLGILVPAYLKVRDRAKETEARITARNLQDAFRSYLDYYRTWPSDFGDESAAGEQIKGNVFRIMRGENINNANPNTYVFYEFATTNFTEGALDPLWDPLDENTKQPYRVRVDANYDNKISVGGNDIYRSVIVWSCGWDHTNDFGADDDIRSWE
ncbi:MAG: type II secretion system protein [Lentisphaerae bacterium]|nr:type II secretion system protein [Lentisphaerota bacterium]